jgi:hypothetical protein
MAVSKPLARDRLLMVTHSPEGESFGLDTGQAVTAKKAREIQADLFVTPQNDGLFPGFSQTWKREA